jgi:hypothetical protein
VRSRGYLHRSLHKSTCGCEYRCDFDDAKKCQGPASKTLKKTLPPLDCYKDSPDTSRTMNFLKKMTSNLSEAEPQSSLGPDNEPSKKNLFSQLDIKLEFKELHDLALSLAPSTAPVIHKEDLQEVIEEGRVMEPDHGFLWHEIVVKPFVDPISGKKLVMIQQNDVSTHLDQQSKLSRDLMLVAESGSLSEQQLVLLSASFPRHVLEHPMHPTGRMGRLSNDSNIISKDIFYLPSEIDPTGRFWRLIPNLWLVSPLPRPLRNSPGAIRA